MTYSVTGQPSANGTITLDGVAGTFSYEPSIAARDLAATTSNQDFTTFTVTATDGQAATVIPVSMEIAPTQSTPQLAPSTTQIALGAWPDFLATKGSRVYVLNAGDSTVSVIDTNTNTVIDTSDQLSAGGAMVLSPDGKLYVAEYVGNRVLVLDAATLEQVDTINVTTTYGGTLAVSQNGQYLYVGSTTYDLVPYYDEYGNPYYDEYGNPYYSYVNPKGSVSVVNTTTKGVIANIPIGPSIGNVELSPDGRLLYANAPDRVHVINAVTNTYVTSFSVGGRPADVAFSPDSRRAYITNLQSGELYVIDTVTNAVIAKPIIDTLDYRYVAEWDYWYEAGFPTDLAVSKDGSRVYVARGDDIVVVDAARNTVINEIRVATDIPNDGAQSLTIADNGTIYVTLEDTVVAVHVTPPPAGSGMVSETLGAADPGQTSLTLVGEDAAESTGSARMASLAVMSASAPAVPTVGSPNLVTGTVSGSLNGYTVTAQPASGKVDVVGDTYTYTPTAAARLRAAVTTQPDYDSFPVAISGQPATSVSVAVLPGVLSNSAMPGAAVLNNPTGLAVHGNYAYVANQGTNSNTVSVINTTHRGRRLHPHRGEPALGRRGHPATPAPPSASGYVTNRASGTVSVINTTNKAVVGSAIRVGSSPQDVAVAHTPAITRVYVANSGGNNVSVIDARNSNRVSSINLGVGNSPQAVAVSPDGTRAYVAYRTAPGAGRVSVINTANNTIIATVNVGSSPQDVAVSPLDNRVYVANNGSSSVSVINPAANNSVSTINVGSFPTSLAVSPDKSVVLVARSDDGVAMIDTKTNTVIGAQHLLDTTTGDDGGHIVAFSPDGRGFVTDAADHTVRVSA